VRCLQISVRLGRLGQRPALADLGADHAGGDRFEEVGRASPQFLRVGEVGNSAGRQAVKGPLARSARPNPSIIPEAWPKQTKAPRVRRLASEPRQVSRPTLS
jgi:hypothetical protein